MTTKFTPEARAVIIAAIEEGNYYHVAARCAGVSASAFKNWMTLGKSKNPEHAEFAVFATLVKQARSKSERVLVEKITVASIKHWQAAAWMLERRNPARWAKQDRQPLAGKSVETMTDAELDATVKGKS